MFALSTDHSLHCGPKLGARCPDLSLVNGIPCPCDGCLERVKVAVVDGVGPPFNDTPPIKVQWIQISKTPFPKVLDGFLDRVQTDAELLSTLSHRDQVTLNPVPEDHQELVSSLHFFDSTPGDGLY